MIKLYFCRARQQAYATADSKKVGYYKQGEEFLLYRNSKGNWLATTPFNSGIKSHTFLVKQNGEAKSHWMLNMEHVNITDVFVTPNKKTLTKSIEVFEQFKKESHLWSGEQML